MGKSCMGWRNSLFGCLHCASLKFKCSIDQVKRSFYRAANSIFAKLGRLASDEVIIQLVKQKYLPILLYALEVCNLDKRSLQSLDFTVNRFFYKVVQDIQYRNCTLLSKYVWSAIAKRIVRQPLSEISDQCAISCL